MLIVGELINASRRRIAEAIEAGDAAAIRRTAKRQVEAGAHFIDVNAGTFGEDEPERLAWLVREVQAETEAPCSIDSPDPRAVEAALRVHRGTAMINSISLEKDRFEALVPMLAGTDLKVVALCMDDEGMPETADDRVRTADRLVNALVRRGIATGNIHVDPLVQPISVRNESGLAFLESVRRIREALQGVHVICGLSNVSYGLPQRRLLNRVFLTMAVAAGLDSAILDPLERRTMAALAAAEALAGGDAYCSRYLKAHRAGLLEA